MKIIKTKFKDLLIIKNKRFLDSRGFFREILIEKLLKKKFPFNVISVSKKNVIRGIHFQAKNTQGKFISVIKGKIFDVAVDLRKNSNVPYNYPFRFYNNVKNKPKISESLKILPKETLSCNKEWYAPASSGNELV